MDGWGFWGNWKRRMSACEEGKDMIGIAYLVEGSGGSQQRNVEGLVGRRVIPHTLLRSLLVEEELHRGQRNDDRFRLDTQEYVSQLHLSRYALPGT